MNADTGLPTRDEFACLSHEAAVAFAARCAGRVLPIVQCVEGDYEQARVPLQLSLQVTVYWCEIAFQARRATDDQLARLEVNSIVERNGVSTFLIGNELAGCIDEEDVDSWLWRLDASRIALNRMTPTSVVERNKAAAHVAYAAGFAAHSFGDPAFFQEWAEGSMLSAALAARYAGFEIGGDLRRDFDRLRVDTVELGEMWPNGVPWTNDRWFRPVESWPNWIKGAFKRNNRLRNWHLLVSAIVAAALAILVNLFIPDSIMVLAVVMLLYSICCMGLTIYHISRHARSNGLVCLSCGKAIVGGAARITMKAGKCGFCGMIVFVPQPKREA